MVALAVTASSVFSRNSNMVTIHAAAPDSPRKLAMHQRRRFQELCATRDGSSSSEEESVPSWAKPGSDEPPPWARSEPDPNSPNNPTLQLPYGVYLLASAITAIAAIGSIFEYTNQNPVFGILKPDSIFYAPLLGFFVFTGIPTSAFLWFKSVQVANKEAEEQDRRDGFL